MFIRRFFLATSLFLSLSPFALGVNTGAYTLLIDTSEGGSSSPRLTRQLALYLVDEGCPMEVSVGDTEPDKAFSAYFRALSGAADQANFIGNAKLKAAAVLEFGNYSQAAILVRASTGISSVTSLGSVHMAFVNQKSITGYLDQQEILRQADVEIDTARQIFTDSHIGALSLLMHGDVFAAGVDVEIADKWAQHNGLKTIARGPARTPGGLYVSKDIDPAILKACVNALTGLNRDQKPGKSLLKLFPDWLTGFREVD